MSASSLSIRTLSLVAAALMVSGCSDWFTTFSRQPAIHPWQVATMDADKAATTPPRGNPQGSVHITGDALPDWVFSYSPFPGTLDSMSVLVNPREATEESINNGHRYYQMNCAVCHGDAGQGDGGATASGMPPISLLSQTALAHSAGYLYAIIRNGRGAMPSYNRIEPMGRWDLVNYILGLQGKLGRTVPTGPLGTPGETGDKVPGVTDLGPQRPPPHFPPARIGGGE